MPQGFYQEMSSGNGVLKIVQVCSGVSRAGAGLEIRDALESEDVPGGHGAPSPAAFVMLLLGAVAAQHSGMCLLPQPGRLKHPGTVRFFCGTRLKSLSWRPCIPQPPLVQTYPFIKPLHRVVGNRGAEVTQVVLEEMLLL